jgi:hypothetical protein
MQSMPSSLLSKRVLTVSGMECGIVAVVDVNGEGNILGAGGCRKEKKGGKR